MITNLHEHVARATHGKIVLITGGAGFIGSALAHRLARYGVKQLRLLDHNEERTFYLDVGFRKNDCVRVFLGDVRDRNRMRRALQGVDIVVHTAALKHIEVGEYNPFEVVSTNLSALQSLIELALDLNVAKFVFTSSHKAVSPADIMGGSKFIGERLVTAANGYRGGKHSLFCCTRFGKVLGSAGSVLPTFERQIRQGGPVTVTEPEMTRFFMTLDEAVDLVLTAMVASLGGEIFVPKMHAVRLIDLAEAMMELHAPGQKIPIERIGLRPGEKFYEELITDYEQGRCLETERLLIVLPYLNYYATSGGRPHKQGPEDYPDRPAWARQLFSSQSAKPLGGAAVRQLLEQPAAPPAGAGLSAAI